MSGRIDDVAHEKSARRISENSLLPNEIRDHLDIVLSSQFFRGSRRGQEFLEYVVKCALDGDLDRLKERLIGIHLFRRNPAYDTSEDSIVRVTANDVRKRLNAYYKSGPAKGIRIEVPIGSYVPDFVSDFRRVGSTLPDGSSPRVPNLATKQLARIVLASETEVQSEAETMAADTSFTQPPDTRRKRFLIQYFDKQTWLLACSGGVLFLAGWGMSFCAGWTHSEVPIKSELKFYTELLGPISLAKQKGTSLVLSNPELFLYRGSSTSGPDSRDTEADAPIILIPDSLDRELKSEMKGELVQYPFSHLTFNSTDYTGLGEAKAAFSVGKILDAVHRPSSITDARFLDWEKAGNENLIVLGAPHMSKWIRRNLTCNDFTLEHDQIRNTRPLSGEQTSYRMAYDGTVLEDYGVISMRETPSGGRILLLAGITSTGTAGTGLFFANPEEMHIVYEALKRKASGGTFPANWEVLVKVTARDKVPLKWSVISVHTMPTCR